MKMMNCVNNMGIETLHSDVFPTLYSHVELCYPHLLKKHTTLVLGITLAHIDQFSKYFHVGFSSNIYSKTLVM